ncbi:MAG: phosphoenolpyruvate hydrolase family protein [Chloroflexi bacterium]|nr:phosphoenolpyruvate hydrolase family protein [Chloroflexota bacterium]
MTLDNARPFTRARIIARLREQIAQGRPIVGAGSSSGLIARSAEAGGADLIIVYNTGTSRLMGLPTTHTMNHANPSTLAMYDEIANVVTHTPIIGGGEAQDPTYLDLKRLVRDFRETGFDGMINFPTTGPGGSRNRDRSSVGLGMDRDFEMVKLAREQDYFTICYGYTEEQTIGLAAAGADAIVGHAGWTTGGLAGAGASAMSLDAACEHVQKMVDLARRENPEVIVLAHGGPISSAEDTRYLYEHTDAQGFLGASSMERIPVESAIVDAVRAFKSKQPRASRDQELELAAGGR